MEFGHEAWIQKFQRSSYFRSGCFRILYLKFTYIRFLITSRYILVTSRQGYWSNCTNDRVFLKSKWSLHFVIIALTGGPWLEEEKAEPKSEDAPHAATIPYGHNLPVDEKALESKEAMWAFYEYWCKYHGISRERREMKRRFRTFSATARFVHKSNNSRTDVKFAMNRFADMTQRGLVPGRGWNRRMISPSLGSFGTR